MPITELDSSETIGEHRVMIRPIQHNRDLFGSPARNLMLALTVVLAIWVLMTLAYVGAGWSLSDASYMVTLTIFSVGYGETHPIDTPYLRAVTMATMVLGCTGMIFLTSILVQYLTSLQLRQLMGHNRVMNRIEQLDGHVVICGFGRIGVMLARDLAAARMPFVVVERDAGRIAEAEAEGYLALAGDATDESLLIEAGIQRARVLATVLPDDAANVFITLSARTLNPMVEIIARGELPSTESKLHHAGADRVVLPAHIGAERIAHMILHPMSLELKSDERLGQIAGEFESVGLAMERVTVASGSAIDGLSVADAERRAGGAMFVVQVESSSQTYLRPPRELILRSGDSVLVVARQDAAPHALFTSREKVKHGRALI